MINELESTLKQALGWHKSRVQCLVQILLGLITVRTVNLKQLATAMSGEAQIDSHYRRLQRFFAYITFPEHVLARLIVGMFIPNQAFYLSMDRTNWQWGKSNLNILMLSVCYQGVALPIYWKALDKKGNSNTEERINIMNRFLRGFGKARIASLLGDREFIGEDWFAYLIQEGIPFDMRIKKNHVATSSKGIQRPVSELFKRVKSDGSRALQETQVLMGQSLYLSACRCVDGELLILASSREPHTALSRYKQRWEIETLFACLKGRGFCAESTRLTDLKRIEAMFATMALAFAWAHKVGDWRHENQKPIKRKKHGRLSISYFRYGLDKIRQALLAGGRRIDQLQQAISLWVDSMPDLYGWLYRKTSLG